MKKDKKTKVELAKVDRRKILKGVGAAGALTAMSGLVPFSLSSVVHAAAHAGKSFVIGLASEADGLSSAVARPDHLGRLIERGILDYDRAGASFKIVPGTAAAMPEVLDNGLRFRFKIRDDVYFHDGSKMDAESVAYWVDMQINKKHPLNKSNKWRTLGRLKSIKKVVAVDKYTVDFYLKKFNAAQMDWFTDIGYQGLPVEPLKNKADLFNTDLSAGPYMIASRQRGGATVLKRFDKYFDSNEGKAPRIGLKTIPEVNARMAALEAGEIDWMDGLSSESAQYLKKVDGINVSERKTLYVWFITLDMRHKPLNDVRVRQALNYAVDKESLIRDVLGGAAERSYSPLSRQFGDFYAGDKVKHYDYDPDKAKALLKEAGYADGFKSTIYTNTGRVGQMKPIEMSQFVQANWKAVGVDCNIESSEWSAFESRRRKGEFPIATRGWTPSTADPDGLVFQNFHSSMVPPTQRNVAFLQDPEVDRWLDTGMGTLDMEERLNAFIEAQKRIAELAPWVFVCHEITFEAFNKNLLGYKVHPAGRGRSLTYAYKG